jgi:hypothetical protein
VTVPPDLPLDELVVLPLPPDADDEELDDELPHALKATTEASTSSTVVTDLLRPLTYYLLLQFAVPQEI